MRHPSSRGRRDEQSGYACPAVGEFGGEILFTAREFGETGRQCEGGAEFRSVADRDLDGGISGQQPGAFGGPHGLHQTEYPDHARRAVIAMCNAVAQWYRPDGPVTEDELVERATSRRRRPSSSTGRVRQGAPCAPDDEA
ncbi:hypothetical protein [Streptomyces sp. NBC_00353]|uniref:hypothetical protein n=1 Tax=Streptomyces sp. NBC_00353 TaxID=2975722 RepID=UPI003FA6D564